MKELIKETYSEPIAELPDPLVIHRRSESSRHDTLVIFIHGLGGRRYGPRATWGDFPRFLFEDVPRADVGLYAYRSLFGRLQFWRSINLEDEARILAEIIRDAAPYPRIVLIGHSMGGLLAKAAVAYLLQTRQAKSLNKLGGLILMATPQAGSLRVPRFLWGLTPDSRALRPHGDLVQRIDKAFLNWLCTDPDTSDLSRPILPTWAIISAHDRWVDKLSAGLSLPDSQTKLVRESHTSLVKPKDKHQDAYSFVRGCIEGVVSHPRPQRHVLRQPLLDLKIAESSDPPSIAPQHPSPATAPGGEPPNHPALEVYRVEASLRQGVDTDTLTIDYGFFPFYISSEGTAGEGAAGEAIACGCRVARSVAKLTTGSIVKGPQVEQEPGDGRMIVEFTSLTNSQLRFQSPPRSILDGQGRVGLSIDWNTIAATPPPRVLEVQIQPLVFGVQEFDGADSSYATLVFNAVLPDLDLKPVTKSFRF